MYAIPETTEIDESALQYYKTPRSVISQLVTRYISGNPMRILEPSAGNGAIVDYIVSGHKGFHDVSCCEISPDRRAILTGKGYKVIGHDFLEMYAPYRFNLVVMNPPFRAGVKHVLKAWEMLYPQGSLAAILPSTALEHSDGIHRQLNQLIELFGEVEQIGSAFSDAERKTNVDCVIVRLSKPAAKQFDPFERFNPKQDEFYNPNVEQDNTPIARDLIQALVSTYRNAALNLKVLNEAEQQYYYSVPGRVKTHINSTARSSYAERVDYLKESYWELVFERTGIGSTTTSNYRKTFFEQKKTISQMEFSVEAIYEVLDLFMTNADSIRRDCVLALFREMTRWDKNNSIAPFKTNKGWKLAERAIIPYCFLYPGSWSITSSRTDVLNDLDKVIGMFGGINEVCTVKAIEEHMRGLNKSEKYSDKFLTPNFEVRVYMKGTIHLKFRDSKVLEFINRFAAEREFNVLGTG